jgi:hypothetical protein
VPTSRRKELTVAVVQASPAIRTHKNHFELRWRLLKKPLLRGQS